MSSTPVWFLEHHWSVTATHPLGEIFLIVGHRIVGSTPWACTLRRAKNIIANTVYSTVYSVLNTVYWFDCESDQRPLQRCRDLSAQSQSWSQPLIGGGRGGLCEIRGMWGKSLGWLTVNMGCRSNWATSKGRETWDVCVLVVLVVLVVVGFDVICYTICCHRRGGAVFFMIFYWYFGISVLIHLLKGGILFFDERLVFYVITRYSKPTVTREFWNSSGQPSAVWD